MLHRYCPLILLVIACADQVFAVEDWKVGLAKVVITPDEPTWLSGYSHRTHPAEGKAHDLFAKAAAFESADGTRFVPITFDLGSVKPHTTEEVAARVEKQFQLPRSNLLLNCSHTHCALEYALERCVFHKFPDEEETKLARYPTQLSDKLVDLVGKALADLQPAELSVSRSEAKFAFNRRHPSGIDKN
jgi:hypothetical protein